MVLIFDLDDTLYLELDYVYSGFFAVARMLAQAIGADERLIYQRLLHTLHTQGRGRVFNSVLEGLGLTAHKWVQKSLSCYRSHQPTICLYEGLEAKLSAWADTYPLYLVTDGNKLVQAKKVSALNISRWFRKVLITHRYGVQHAKPSTYCFEKIRQMERCQYHEMAYIADNPHKDFVGLKPLGILTVRVMTGSHRHIELAPAYEAAQRIDTILDFQPERLFMR